MWKRVKRGMQGRVARFRVPGGAEPAGAPDERLAGDAGSNGRPMPLAASILWKPIDAAAEQGAGLLPVFIAQRALAAVCEHCGAVRETSFGLLAGRLLRTPDTGAWYVVVESTIRLPGGIGDDAKAALLQGWVVAEDVVRRTGDRLVGWYRCRSTTEAGLTAAEAATHAALFAEPWQVAVAVGTGDATVGGVFRRSASSAWAQECLPFYELIDPSSFRPDGSKPTRLRWDSYRTEETALVTSAALPVPAVSAVPAPVQAPPAPPVAPARRTPAPAPQVFWPEQFGDADDAQAGGAEASGTRVGRAGRWVAYAAAGLLAVAGLFRLYSAVGSPASPGSSPGTPAPARAPAPAAVAAIPLDRVDRAADTLALAIAAFDLRVRLFASRQMQCPELARGLIVVEENWTTYNSIRRDSGAPLDSARAARDRALYTDVDAVEQQFERSACTRP